MNQVEISPGVSVNPAFVVSVSKYADSWVNVVTTTKAFEVRPSEGQTVDEVYAVVTGLLNGKPAVTPEPAK